MIRFVDRWNTPRFMRADAVAKIEAADKEHSTITTVGGDAFQMKATPAEVRAWLDEQPDAY